MTLDKSALQTMSYEDVWRVLGFAPEFKVRRTTKAPSKQDENKAVCPFLGGCCSADPRDENKTASLRAPKNEGK